MIAAARACLGTPFHHQGRLPGVGLDCIGLIVVALQAVGCIVADRRDYARRPDGTALAAALAAHGAVRVDAPLPGDVLLFAFDGQPQHVAMLSAPDCIIHAYAPAGKVVEVCLNGSWRRRVVAFWRF